VERPPNSGPYTAAFTVDNSGNSAGGFTLTCTATGGVTCGTVTPSGVSLNPDASANVNVQYTVGATSGTLRLTAAHGTWTDGGFYNVIAAVAGPPVVTLRNHNRDNVDRSLCLTAGAGESAAWGCGDLVITHSLPGYSTMGRERSLTLIHNSATAYPRPAIAAVVTQPTGISAPTTVFAELKVGGTVRTSASYSAWTSSGQPSRQIVLDFNAAGDGSGAYPIELRVQNQYTGSVQETVIKDTLLIVNRFVDQYGAGFSIAGLERLYFNQPVGTTLGHIFWMGGDGSAKLYRKLNASTWVGPLGAFQDTIALSGGVYTRTLRHGVKVQFNSAGRHIATINRTGQQSTFTYNAAGDRLISIQVPPACGAACTYTLAYDVDANLDYIQDPSGRRLDATFAANDGRLTSLTDPDGNSVVFGWDGDRRIISRRTRRGYTTTYEYSLGRAVGSRITKVTVPVGRVAGDPATAVTVFDAWNDKGLAVGTTGQIAVDTAQAFTRIFGPRPSVADDASFWVDRWGAPVKIVDAVPSTTTLVRGNPAVPALVTRVNFPDGRVDSMTYDGRGNLTKLIDSTRNTPNPLPQSVTTYLYASPNTKDSPSSLTDPESAVTSYLYNTWGLTTQVTSPNTHVTKFTYLTTGSLIGLVKAVTEVSVPAWDSVARRETAGTAAADTLHTGFGFNTLGNVVSDTSPMGKVRRFDRDAQQRVMNFYDAASHLTQFTYDPLNRTLQSKQNVQLAGNPSSLFPADPGFATALTTTSTYDIDVLQSVTDPRGVARSYQYDFASRQIGETDDFGNTTLRWVNNANAVDSVQSRTGRVVRQQYDAAGRRTKTAWPAVAGVSNKDSVLYVNDVMGRMTSATITWPGAASVTRTYYGTGAVRTEVLNSATPLLRTTQAYYYDRAGRRIAHRIGTPGDLVHSDSVHYTWDGVRGELQEIKVWWRTVRHGAIPQDWVRFKWDAMGRRDSVAYSNGLKIGFGYDKDGMQRLLCTATQVTMPAANEVSQIRVLHDWVDPDGMIRKTNAVGTSPTGCVTVNRLSTLNPSNTYDNRHELKSRAENGHTWTYVYDGSGNIIQSTKDTERFDDVMAAGHNQLTRRFRAASNDYYLYEYDADGSRTKENPCPTTSCANPNPGFRQFLYEGLDRTVGFNQYGCTLFDGGGGCIGFGVIHNADAYYDPLGRLIRPYENGSPNLGYDGDNVVRTGSDSTTGFDWTFIHGPGTDDPVLGHYPGTVNRVVFYVTDGQGRQYAAVERDGTDAAPNLDYTQNGGKYAGGTRNSMSFDAERKPSTTVPGLSFFRNRIYDQTTGRWTQEDPIGLAGGHNLYQFNGNNPVSYTDPFGLSKCPPNCGTIHAVGALAFGTLGAVQGAVLGIPGGPGGVVVGAAIGGGSGIVAGVAAGNVAEATADAADSKEMATFGDYIRRLLVAGGIAIGEGVPDRTKGSENPPELEQPAKPPKPDEKKPEEEQEGQ
jgi:RHS repeat-associated protein